MAKNTKKPVVAALPAPQQGGQAPIPARAQRVAHTAAPPTPTVPSPAPAPAAQPAATPTVAAPANTGTMVQVNHPSPAPATPVTRPTRTPRRSATPRTRSTRTTPPVVPPVAPPPAPPPLVTPPPAPTTPPTRPVDLGRRIRWIGGIILLAILFGLILALVDKFKGVSPSVSSKASAPNSFVPSVEEVHQDLSSAPRMNYSSVGVIPAGIHVELPVINLNITNSFNGSGSNVVNRLDFSYHSGDGSVSGKSNSVGNDCGNTIHPVYQPAPAVVPQTTSQWAPQRSTAPYVPPPQDPPMQSSVYQAAPTVVYAPPYSYCPPRYGGYGLSFQYNFGYSHGHSGGYAHGNSGYGDCRNRGRR